MANASTYQLNGSVGVDAAASASVIQSHHSEVSGRLPAYSVHMDAIRALAAFVVVAGHAQMLFFGNHGVQPSARVTPTPIGGKTMGLGHQAVIIFFVLSGFLVGNSVWKMVRQNRWSWRKYLIQRLSRLGIVLIPALVIGGSLDHLGLSFLQKSSIYSAPPGQDMVHLDLPAKLNSKVFLGNVVYLQTILVPSYGTNAALWSLANEFWYYLAFPLFLLAIVTKQSMWIRLSYALLGLGILVFTGAAIALLFPIWLLGFGVSLLHLRIPPQSRIAFTAGCFFQFLAVNAAVKVLPMPAFAADLLLGLSFSLYLYSILHARQPIGSLTYQKVAVHFSKFSYTLYLVHLPFLIFMTGLLIVPWQKWPKDALHLLASVLLVAVAYLYALVLYFLFEKNTDKLRNFLQSGSTALYKGKAVL